MILINSKKNSNKNINTYKPNILIKYFISFLFINFLIVSNIYASLDLSNLNQNKSKHPTAEQAFSLNSFIKNNNEIQLLISAIDNTYIYQNSFKFTTNNSDVNLYQAQYPESKTIIDDHYGETKVFSNSFEITIPYQANKKQDFELTIEYQGCLKDILCYPPKQTTFMLSALASSGDTMPTLEPMTTRIQAVEDQNNALSLLNGASVFTIIGGFIVFGLFLSLTPCVLPMLPILSGIIAGHQEKTSKLHAFMLSFVYVFSMATTFMLAGILAASAGLNLTQYMQQPPVLITISLLFIFFAIASFGFIELKLPSFINQRLNNLQQNQKGGTYIGVAIMGVLATLVVSPCATAPLSAALLYISTTGNILLGGLALFSMGFAMGFPLLIFGTSAGHLLPKAGPWMREINVLFGVLFIGLAIFLISRIIPGPLTLVLYALLLIFYAVYLGLLEPAIHTWQRVQKGFALVIAIYGSFLLAGATQNQSDILHPFGIINSNSNIMAESNSSNIATNYIDFTKIKKITELENKLSEAKKNNQITIVDFYADWCVSCRNIEKKVFTDPKVSKILNTFQRLKVDLTHSSADDKKIMSELSVFNPPTLIFYDTNGKEIENSRIIGEVEINGFYQHILKLSS